MDDHGYCVKCDDTTNSRIYEGYCVNKLKYIDLENFASIEESTTASSFENCSIIRDQKCTGCLTGFSLGNDSDSSSKCCWNSTDK